MENFAPSPEFIALLIIVLVVMLAFVLLHPMMAGNNLRKLIINDFLAMGCAALCIGSLYWGSDIKFSLIFFDVNWLVFTIVAYSTIEIPFFNRYLKKHSVRIDFD